MKLANITLAPTIRKYNKENLVHDVITGLNHYGSVNPISMGYAQIAGLPAVYGYMVQYFHTFYLHYFRHHHNLYLVWMQHRQPWLVQHY